MQTKESSKEIFNNANGYLLGIQLDFDELSQLRELIKAHWLYRLQTLVPKYVKDFDQSGMAYYHKLSYLIDHQQAWPTATRILSRNAVSLVRGMRFFKKLCNLFGAISIADEEKFGWENIQWRLVRPHFTDYASLHIDRWFWDLADWPTPHFPHQRINIWIAIDTVSGKNGLLVLPGSHLKKDWKWHYEFNQDRKKPILDEAVQDNLKLLPTESGCVVIFHHDLLHGGAPNIADTSRVSLEFTIFAPLKTG